MRETYEVAALHALGCPGPVELAVDGDHADGREGPRGAEDQRGPRGAVVPFLRREAQVDAHDAALGDVDGDDVEEVADGDELISQKGRSLRLLGVARTVWILSRSAWSTKVMEVPKPSDTAPKIKDDCMIATICAASVTA